MPGSILIVIVNYRTAGMTIDCLRSLEPEVRSCPLPTRVALVENGSGDDSAARLREAIARERWESWVRLTEVKENRGFAAGNNAAIGPALASGDPPSHVWMLNPDTVAHPGALRALLDTLEQGERIGLAASRAEDPDGTVQTSAFRFPTWISEIESGFRLGPLSKLLRPWVLRWAMPDGAGRVDWAAGASLLIRKEVFDAVGLLDEKYFMYFEEVDFCLAARRAGWECWYQPRSRIIHYVGQSSGIKTTAQRQRPRPVYWFESRRRYFVKNWGGWRTALADAGWMLGFATWRIRRALMRRPDNDPPGMLGTFARESVFRKGFSP